LNYRVAFPDVSSYEIESLENEMFNLGAKCVLLTISPENVEQRIQSRGPHEWTNKTKEEIKKASDECIQTQSELRNQSSKSDIPTIEIKTDNKEWITYASK
jgi:hypothetical protein